MHFLHMLYVLSSYTSLPFLSAGNSAQGIITLVGFC